MAIEPSVRAKPVETIQPSPEQLERRRKQQRFTRLWVYLPTGTLTALSLVAIILLLWLALASPEAADIRVAISGVADLVMILFMTPMVVLCAVPAFGPIALYVYLRRQRDEEMPGWTERLRRLLWRVENAVISIRETVVDKVLPRMVEPVVSAYALAAFVRTLFAELKKAITREINKYGR